MLKSRINETTVNVDSTEFDLIPVEKYWSNEQALIIYAVMIILIILMVNARNLLFYKILLNSSRNIHNKMFSCLIRAPMQFFNANPAGESIKYSRLN